ncbi:hypothetical protein BH11PSE7_BH11PSE7_29950 [soil metagenome]
MPFLSSKASFPHTPQATAPSRQESVQGSTGTPAWARPRVSWPFLAPTSLSARRSSLSAPASFNA